MGATMAGMARGKALEWLGQGLSWGEGGFEQGEGREDKGRDEFEHGGYLHLEGELGKGLRGCSSRFLAPQTPHTHLILTMHPQRQRNTVAAIDWGGSTHAHTYAAQLSPLTHTPWNFHPAVPVRAAPAQHRGRGEA